MSNLSFSKKIRILSLLLIFAIIALIVLGLVFKDETQNKAWRDQQAQDRAWVQSLPPSFYATPYAIKTAAYWTSPIMYPADVAHLAKHDIVIADLENKFNNRGMLLELKRLNPNLKLFCYSNPMEIFLTKYPTRPWQNAVIDEIVTNRPQWLLKTIALTENNVHQEQYAKFWPSMIMLNLSASCPKIKGQTYADWIAKKLQTEILSDPIWDNQYFQDNGTANIAWTYPHGNEKIDINGDQKPDNDVFVDATWKKGINNYLSWIRYGEPEKSKLLAFLSFKKKRVQSKIITNKGDLNLLDKVDGKLFEKFPNDYLGDKWAGGWRQCMHNAERTGPMTIFQVERNDVMFGLASALLLDNVYLAIGQDDAGYFPELELNLGKARGKMRQEGNTYYRLYERATVRVYPLERRGEIISHY